MDQRARHTPRQPWTPQEPKPASTAHLFNNIWATKDLQTQNNTCRIGLGRDRASRNSSAHGANMSQKVLLIVNPVSGRRKHPRRLMQVMHAVMDAGYDLIGQPTHGPGHATRMAAKAGDDVHAVLVYGGDGTVREVAEGLVGRGIPLYHLPAGNENLFAKHFGMGFRTADILAALHRREVRQVDGVLVNDKVFITCLGVGFDAEVVRLTSQLRRGHISQLGYVWPIMKAFFHYRWPRLEVEADGKKVFEGQGMIFAGNLPRYAVGIPLFGRAVYDDGLLDVMIFACRNRRTLLKDTLATLAWKHYDLKDGSVYVRAQSLTVRSPDSQLYDVPTQIDGDRGPMLPVTATVRKGYLSVLMTCKGGR